MGIQWWISIVIPDFKRHKIIMASRVYFLKTVNEFKDVSIMSLQDEKWRRTSCKQSRRITAFSVGITILNQRIIWKDDIEFVTVFTCILGHPVYQSESSHLYIVKLSNLRKLRSCPCQRIVLLLIITKEVTSGSTPIYLLTRKFTAFSGRTTE